MSIITGEILIYHNFECSQINKYCSCNNQLPQKYILSVVSVIGECVFSAMTVSSRLAAASPFPSIPCFLAAEPRIVVRDT